MFDTQDGWSGRRRLHRALRDQCRAEGCHWDYRRQLDRGRSHQYQE